jgi:hypothetical protein
MRNLKALWNRTKTGNTLHCYAVTIETEILVNAHNKIEAKNLTLDAREAIDRIIRQHELAGLEVNVRVKSL